jgi:hypothetical protein
MPKHEPRAARWPRSEGSAGNPGQVIREFDEEFIALSSEILTPQMRKIVGTATLLSRTAQELVGDSTCYSWRVLAV